MNKLILGDCLEEMDKLIEEGVKVDMILADLPYGTTACKWDSIIPFDELWERYEKIIKDNGAIVLFGSQPFTTKLINSNIENFKYQWIWNKKKAGNIFLAKYQPMKIHEDICVFSKKTHYYYPQKVKRDKIKKSKNYGTGESLGGQKKKEEKVYEYTHKNPISILEFSNASQKGKFHPTQKPVDLYEYLIKTYTNENETVLDNCSGSGTTGIAALNTSRNYILIEKDETYFNLAKERIEKHLKEKGGVENE